MIAVDLATCCAPGCDGSVVAVAELDGRQSAVCEKHRAELLSAGARLGRSGALDGIGPRKGRVTS